MFNVKIIINENNMNIPCNSKNNFGKALRKPFKMFILTKFLRLLVKILRKKFSLPSIFISFIPPYPWDKSFKLCPLIFRRINPHFFTLFLMSKKNIELIKIREPIMKEFVIGSK